MIGKGGGDLVLGDLFGGGGFDPTLQNRGDLFRGDLIYPAKTGGIYSWGGGGGDLFRFPKG